MGMRENGGTLGVMVVVVVGMMMGDCVMFELLLETDVRTDLFSEGFDVG